MCILKQFLDQSFFSPSGKYWSKLIISKDGTALGLRGAMAP